MAAATVTRSRRTCRCRRLPARNLPSAKSSPSWPTARDSHGAGASHPAPLLNLGHLDPHGRRDWPTCREPRNHLRRPVPLQPELPADAAPLTLSKRRRLGVGIRDGRAHTGVGFPARTRWLFPRGMPGKPITASQLGGRLRALGIYAMPGRRGALTDLAAKMPAAVLADLLHLSPGTPVRWVHQAGGDWSRYAAELARGTRHQT
jgi:hypothetical protein